MIELDLAVRTGAFEVSASASLDARVLGVFGPSGAGKTTLLDAVAGLVTPRHGKISVGGRTLFDSKRAIDVAAADRSVGYVFQDTRLFPHRSVRANLSYGSRRARRCSRETMLLDGVCQALDLGPHLDRAVGNLSGGERQRVALGRALVSGPDVLLLDEPLTGLDEWLKARALDLVRDASQRLGVIVFYVSHSLWEIQELTESVLFLDRGHLIAAGSLFDVLCQEQAFALASRLGLENVLAVEVVGHDDQVTIARLGGHDLLLPRVSLAPGTRAHVAIRPGDIVVARERVEGLSARNLVRGRVERVVEVGKRWLVTVDVGQPVRVELTRSSYVELGVGESIDVWLLLKTFAFRWLP